MKTLTATFLIALGIYLVLTDSILIGLGLALYGCGLADD